MHHIEFIYIIYTPNVDSTPYHD